MKEILIPLNFSTTPTLYDTQQSFSTSDVASGVLIFTTTADVSGSVASLTIRNASENANRQTVLVDQLDVKSSPFSYIIVKPLPFGNYEGEITLKKGTQIIASAMFLFEVNSSLSASVLPKLVEAYSLDALVEEVETEVSNLKDAYTLTVSETVKGVNKTESILQAQENVRYLNEHTRKNNNSLWKAQAEAFALAEENRVIEFNNLVDTSVIEQVVVQEVAEKYQEIEATQANRLLSVESELVDKIGAGVKAEPEDLSATTLGLVTGTGGPINLLSIPQDLSVTAEKTNYISPASNQNIFNSYLATDGYRLSTAGALTADAFYTLSTFIPVTNGKTYMIVTGGAATGRICGYNTSKVFNKVVSSGLASGGTILVGFDGYIRVPVLLTLKFTTQIVDNSIYNGIFTPFEYAVADVMRSKPKKRSVTDDTVLNASLSYRKMDFISDGKNLFNPSSRTLNLLLSDLVSAYYDTTEYIPVKTGTTYTLNQARRYALYNIDKIIIGATVEKPDNAAVSVTPTQDGYMRASVSKALVDTFQVEIGNVATPFEPYERRVTNLTIDVSDIKFDSLKGKKLLNLGDSIGYGSDVSYAFQLADKYGMVLTNRASGGASVSDEIPANNVQLQLSQAIAANDNPDIIFIDGGTNDLSYTVGTITPDFTTALNTSSFCGGLETIFKTIRTTWPQAMVIYIIPHCMRKSLTAMADVFGKGVQIAKKYGVPVVSIYEEGNLNTNFIPQSTLYTIDTYSTGEGDGTHPNELGYKKFYNPLIEAKLKAVMSTD